jgi:hypothetical protein
MTAILFIVSLIMLIIGITFKNVELARVKWVRNSLCSALDGGIDCIGICGSAACVGRLHYKAIKLREEAAQYKKLLTTNQDKE